MTVGPKQYVHRASCNAVEVRLRVNPGDDSWIVIKSPGVEPSYREIPEDAVAGVADRFNAIGDDPARFDSFVKSFS